MFGWSRHTFRLFNTQCRSIAQRSNRCCVSSIPWSAVGRGLGGRGPRRKGVSGASLTLIAQASSRVVTLWLTTNEGAGSLDSQRRSDRRASTPLSMIGWRGYLGMGAAVTLLTWPERSNAVNMKGKNRVISKAAAKHGAGVIRVGLGEHRTERRKKRTGREQVGGVERAANRFFQREGRRASQPDTPLPPSSLR